MTTQRVIFRSSSHFPVLETLVILSGPLMNWVCMFSGIPSDARCEVATHRSVSAIVPVWSQHVFLTDFRGNSCFVTSLT